MENLAIDENGRNVLGGITNDASEFIKNLRVNPMTGRLLVDAHLTSTNTQIGDTIPGGTAGSVLFLDLGSTLEQDNAHFFYDSTNHRLGLGTTTPAATLDVHGTFKYVDGNQTANYVLVSSATGVASWQDISSNTTIINNIASSTTFVNDLISNTTFTTNLAGDNNFTTTLAGNSTFVTSLTTNTTFTNDLGGLVAVAVDGVTITGNGTTGSPLIAHLTGTGTVTTISVATANGFAGSVANPTTTPVVTLTTSVTGIVTANGTAISGTTFAQGDIFYGSGTNTIAKLAKNTSSTRYISNTGTSNNPAWAQIDLTTGVTGALPVANGGTGDSSLTAYAVLCGGTTSTAAIQSIASVGSSGQILTSNGAGALPTFQNASSGSLYTVNADESISGWQTNVMLPVYTGWGAVSTQYGNGAELSNATTSTTNGLLGYNNTTPGADLLLFNIPAGKVIKIKCSIVANCSSSSNFVGFGFSNVSTNFYSLTNSTDYRIQFLFDNANAYSITSNGSTNTNNTLSGVSVGRNVVNICEIIWTPGTDIKFYVNGVLKATHTTSLPTSANAAKIFLGGNGAGTAVGDFSEVTISQSI